MSFDTLHGDLFKVLLSRWQEICDAQQVEVEFVCRQAATEMSAVVMQHFNETLMRHMGDLRHRDEGVAYEKAARWRAERRCAEAYSIIRAAGRTPPHRWGEWEQSAREWLSTQESSGVSG